MKIALCTTVMPFTPLGGARNIVEWLRLTLKEHGHEVELVELPEHDAPELLLKQMMAFRWVDLDVADRIICFRPQSHIIPHDNKVLWFIHHLRLFYDLWDTEYRAFPDDVAHRGIRQALMRADSAALNEAKAVFTNSQVVSDRLMRYNNVESEVLYPPLFQPERFSNKGFGNEIVYVSRLEHHKRQHLLVEALRHTKTPVRLKIVGPNSNNSYPKKIVRLIEKNGLQDRVDFEKRWITEAEKEDMIANCLAVAYLPMDEDSYGYPSLEAHYAAKPVLTTTDSGGVLELVTDGRNGSVCEPDAKAIAEAMDRFYLDRDRTEAMGRNARDRLSELNISWDHVVQRLMS